jgi:hypothetical protein
MHALKLGAVKLWMNKRGIEENQVHLQVRSRKTTLTANEFRDLYEWLEEKETRLVRQSLVPAKKRAPVFALGELCTISGKQLDVDTFGKKAIYVKVVSVRARNRRPGATCEVYRGRQRTQKGPGADRRCRRYVWLDQR